MPNNQQNNHNTGVKGGGLEPVASIARRAGLPIQLNLDYGINHAPARVRAHGLREAHTYPHVARHKGESFRVHASKAWAYPSLELRAGNSWPILGFDCDVPETVMNALVCNHFGRPAPDRPALPEPNMIVQRRCNSHSHVSYCLAKPVHRGASAREAPLRLFARVAEFYRHALGADPGYSGVLTHNPMSSAQRGEFLTHWGCKRPYSLGELSEVIPKGWRLPVVATTEAGRNWSLLRALLKWAGSASNIRREVLAVARVINAGFDPPMSDNEVAGIAKNVEGYRRTWIEQGRFYTPEESEAWGGALGLRSGLARRKGTALEHDRAPWEAEGISRAWWYRKRQQSKCESTLVKS